jgi:UDP-N-acetyl-D-galactosamine dehydrogenase
MNDKTVALVGLGYVGLPLALAFGRIMPTIGFDLSEAKITAYQQGHDPTGEQSAEKFADAKQIRYTTDPTTLSEADFIIVAVPTPVNIAKQPDLTPLIKASEIVGQYFKKGATIIYESTVYPGATEEVCVPTLEQVSGKHCGPDFKVGYSPERINPGDQEHTLETIVKVVSGQDAETLAAVSQLYGQIIQAGVCQASSIKVAEAAKVIENTQRDLNVALINELAKIFQLVGIDTLEVLKAAGTKWNFLPFRPGLVGGHCIGVDPYYLTYKAQQLGYQPEVILAGRRTNDSMGKYIAEQTIKQMIAEDRRIKGATVLVMGLTFKENCVDLRNTRVVDIVQELNSYGVQVQVWDPIADPHAALEEYGIQLINLNEMTEVEAVIAAVAHHAIVTMDLSQFIAHIAPRTPFIDVKSAFTREHLEKYGFKVWRL